MATLDDIATALASIDSEVHYGIASKHDRDKPWNYTVFSREKTSPKDNLTGYTDRYMVAVVREDYVPEGLYSLVIDAMTAIPGVKLDRSRDIEFAYDAKPGTFDVVEMMVLYFIKGVKP